jgi:hypothetical protein
MKQEIFNGYDSLYVDYTLELNQLIKQNYIIQSSNFSYLPSCQQLHVGNLIGTYTIIAHHKNSVK